MASVSPLNFVCRVDGGGHLVPEAVGAFKNPSGPGYICP